MNFSLDCSQCFDYNTEYDLINVKLWSDDYFRNSLAQLKMQTNLSSWLPLQLLTKSWSTASGEFFPFISVVTVLSYPTVESYLNIIPWLENMASPRLLMQTPCSVAHVSSRASSMVHPFLASHVKKYCWAFLEGSSLLASHNWRPNSTG